jgi:membrane-associated phospholipid phosphatase
MKFRSGSATALFFIWFGLIISLSGQTPTTTPSPVPEPSPSRHSLEGHFIQHVFHDQEAIWTSPFRKRNYDAKWMVPIGVGAAALFATDRYTSAWVDRNGGLPVISRDVSWFGKAYATGGVAAAFYLAGRITHDPKERETGVLVAQALVDTGIVTEVLKQVSQRQRPNADEGFGEFFDGGSSFPSGHSSSVWAVASVVAHEYKHNPWIKYGAYAAATAVSMSRYSGRNHFLSDIVIGSAIGFGIGKYVVREYHDPSIDAPKSKTTTRFRPIFVPYYNGRSHSYGGSLVWSL